MRNAECMTMCMCGASYLLFGDMHRSHDRLVNLYMYCMHVHVICTHDMYHTSCHVTQTCTRARMACHTMDPCHTWHVASCLTCITMLHMHPVAIYSTMHMSIFMSIPHVTCMRYAHVHAHAPHAHRMISVFPHSSHHYSHPIVMSGGKPCNR